MTKKEILRILDPPDRLPFHQESLNNIDKRLRKAILKLAEAIDELKQTP